MKLSKLLVSVNFAATIPIVVQTAASAQDPIKVNTSEWLKDSISSLGDSGSSNKSTAVSRAVARLKSKDRDAALSEAQKPILRPFVPNRKLPRRADLEMALKAQEPMMAAEPSSVLSGKVSGFFQNNDESFSSYTDESSQFKASQKTAIGLRQTKTRPERIAEMTRNLMKTIPAISQESAPAVANQPINAMRDLSLITRDGSSVPTQRGFLMMQQAEHSLLNENGPAEQDGNMMSASALQISPQEENMEGPTTMGSAGPPPFPLNLLPEASLKRFIRGSLGTNHSNPSTPRVYFGSWHRSATMNSLPAGGFHTYSTYASRRVSTPAVRRSGSSTVAVVPGKRNHLNSRRYLVSKPPSRVYKPSVEPRVATYPPYAASASVY
jgi:hypothetical protein